MRAYVYEIIQSFSGHNNILTVPIIFIDYTGSINAALFLNQLIYWTDKSSNNGWIYKTYNDWTEEIRLSKSTIHRIIKRLNKNKQIIETRIKKAEGFPTVHYRINQESFIEDFIDFLKEQQRKKNEALIRTNQKDTNNRVKKTQTGVSKRHDAYTETTTETTAVEDNSKELSIRVFSENASGTKNNKKDSSDGKRRRRRKKRSSSMKERVRAKAQERAPKKKKPTLSKHVTTKNVQVIDLWNKKPHLRSHMKQDTKTYQDACYKLHLLQQGELYKHVSKDSLQQDTDYEWFKRQWRRGEIAKAIHNLNEWCKEGNYPQKKDWIKKLSLSDAIFNPKTGTAPLLQAYMRGVKPIYDPNSKLKSEVERRTYFNIYEFFSETMKKTDITTKKQIVDLVKDLQGRREAYRGSWAHYGGDFFGRHVDYPPYQADDLALDYMEFLRGNYPTDFIPHASLTPRGLKIGSYVWKEFCKAFDRKYGCDPIRGPIGDSYDPL